MSIDMLNLAKKLFKIPRSITGAGFTDSLAIINDAVGGGNRGGDCVKRIKSGTKCFDWVIPPVWNVKNAYIITPNGKKI